MTTSTVLDQGWTLSLLGGPAPSGLDLPARIDALVPGCVHTDLLTAGLIDDPLDGANESELAWIGRCRWSYRTSFATTAPKDGEHLEIVLEGVDTVATVRLNGVVLGQPDNQFLTWRYEVTDLVKDGGNELEVLFESALETAEEREREHGPLPHVNAHPYNQIRKMACNFGWDWGPVAVTAGLWRPVRLERWRGTRVTSVLNHNDLVGAADARPTGVARLTVGVLRDPGAPPAELTMTVAGRTTTAAVTGEGKRTVELEIEVPQVSPWWPRGYGDQPLYEASLSLEGQTVWSRRLGFRRVELDMEPDEHGTPLRLAVNDRLVLVKGVNWIPDDVFVTRITRERYRAALADAVDCDCNVVRVWGGGLYESEDFYDATDELGLLVWQDFLFACATYPEEEWMRGSVEAEAREAVGRLAGRASLVMWCGGNEDETAYHEWGWFKGLVGDRAWGEGYYRDLLPRIVAELDPATPYIPNSPFSPDLGDAPNAAATGDAHIWDVWNEKDYRQYAAWTPRFASEFGFAGPMAWSTLVRSVHDAPLAPDGDQLAVHQKAEDGARKLSQGLAGHLPEPTDIRRWHWATQLNQARAVAFGVRHWRSLQPVCTGTIIWQLNDCWPVISWAVVDGDGIRKPAWFALRRAHADRALVLEQVGDGTLRLSVINDLPQPWRAVVRVGRGRRHGDGVTWDERPRIDVPAAGATAVILPEDDDPDSFVVAEANGAPRVVCFCHEDVEAGLPAPAYDARVLEQPDGYEVRVRARTLLRDLAVDPDQVAPGAAVDEMLVDLLPGENVSFRVTSGRLEDPSALTRWPALRTANHLLHPGGESLA